MLMFQVDGEPWALATTAVKDLIPRVDLQPCAYVGDGVVGLLNYHSEHVPVMDISAVVGSQPSSDLFSTRIAIVEVDEASTSLGLILDRAAETTHLSRTLELPTQSPFIQATYESPSGQVVRQLALPPLFLRMHSQRMPLQEMPS
ncbi:MAG: chemotaxis protein CheW [Cyanobacteria bacterium J06560_2]